METNDNISEQSDFISKGLKAGHMLEELEAYESIVGVDFADVPGFEDAYAGKYSSHEEFAREQAGQPEGSDAYASWPNSCIDWKWAARELMCYFSENDGCYFRDL